MPSPGADAPTWPDLVAALLRGEDLSTDAAGWAMDQVMRGEASPVQLAGFLVALRAKGETVEELRGLADVMLEHAHRIDVPGPSVDIVGTGGDRMHSVNISTMASVVVASTGLRVVKHGNRAASSSSGSADVLEELGVDLTLSPAAVATVAERVGITFCFAAAFHPSMRHAAVTRRELGIGTAFNALGPLTNPGRPTYAAVGVADARLAPLMAGVFAGRGRPAAVFRGDDGLDELTLATTSTVWWVSGGDVATFTVSPADVGLGTAPVEALRGGDAAFNAEVARRVFAGDAGPVRDAVVLNAGMALAVASEAAPTREMVVAAIAEGVRRAQEALDSGAAARLLQDWADATRALAADAG
ncbi:anthranilate phosphoribosyltransferase [Phycicoccus sp. BSK3Z-2]|uniref:Anthranilate phosphoribosyltransferase n=1 Tax=Phycicoccus avicenniae TaxID=2828860 RepID=A0A941DB45_9MICO|nr:anthranilate phosphoribosyltransferase [Phycicoccus avicenniae]MBR7743157.1 anthranilate phosphoribosyltransferase [Phycicoccus avicenniae]